MAFDIGLALLVLGVARLDHRRARHIRRGCRVCRLWPAARAGLGASRGAGCGADRGRARQRIDRRTAARPRAPACAVPRRRPPASSPASPCASRQRSSAPWYRRGSRRSCCCCPSRAPTLAPQAAANIAATGLGNPVTAVLMAYRAIDTLLETVVLLLALVGIWSLAPDRVLGRLARSAPSC